MTEKSVHERFVTDDKVSDTCRKGSLWIKTYLCSREKNNWQLEMAISNKL